MAHPSRSPLPLLILCLWSLGFAALGQGDGLGEREAALRAAQSLSRGDEEAEAIAEYKKVITDRTGALIVDSLTGRALHGIGASTFIVDEVGTEAAYWYLRAIAVRREVFGELHPDVLRSQSNLGYSYLEWGKLDSAAYFLYGALDRFPRVDRPDTLMWIRTLMDLADVANKRRDIQLLVDVSETCDRLMDVYGKEIDPFERILYHYNLAWYHGLHKITDATRYHAEKGIRLSEAYDESYWMGAIYNVLSINSFHEGNYEASEAYLTKAIDRYGGDDPEEYFSYQANLAELHLVQGRYRQALRVAERALADPVDDGKTRANLYNLTAVAEAKLGNERRAAELFNRGLATVHPGFGATPDGLTYPDPHRLPLQLLNQVVQHLDERARFLAATGQLEQALGDFGVAIVCLEKMRGEATNNTSRRYQSSSAREIFDGAVALCIDLYEATGADNYLWEAFLLSDRARAYTLSANLSQRSAVANPRRFELERTISRLEATAEGDAQKERQLADSRLELDRLLQRDTAITTQDTQPTRETVRDYVDGLKLRLIQYHLAENGSYAFSLAPGEALSYRELPPADSLATATEQFVEAIKSSAFRRRSLRPASEQHALDAALRARGRYLARTLVPGKVKKQARDGDAPTGSGLLLIPDGALSYLPFAALPATDAAGGYLGAAVTLRTAYSVRSLMELKVKPERVAAGVLTLAPDFGRRLQVLAHNLEEAGYVAGYFPGATQLAGPKANRAAYLESASTASLIHLSTHGESNTAKPNRSWIAFSQDADTLVEDQLLFYPEIITRPLVAELVVLSACETNLGRYIPGETTLSLASAFTAAGARSTVTTLWKVDDKATAELMKVFYAGLAGGQTRSTALANAQRTIAATEDYAHPHYWAGVVLTGQDGPVEVPSRGISGWWYGLLGVVVLGAVVGFLAWRRV